MHSVTTHVAVAAASAALALWLRDRLYRRARTSHGGSVAFLPMESLPPDPYELLNLWIADAEAAAGYLEAHAMTIATCDAVGGATARTVVLQLAGEQHGGLLFGSNRHSLKARQAAADERAECVLRFGQRQVRVRGALRLVDSKAALSFSRVAPAARVGLSILEQGNQIDEATHRTLAVRIDQLLTDKHEATLVEPPPSYTAFVLTPATIEFYSGGHPAYLNDRFLYVRAATSTPPTPGCSFAEPIRLQA